MRFLSRSLTALTLLALPGIAFAQSSPFCRFVPCGAGGGADGFALYLRGIALELVAAFGGLVALYLIMAAFTMVTQSRSEGLAEGKQSLTSIAIGCIVVVMAVSIVMAFGDAGGVAQDRTLFEGNLELIVVAIRKALYVAVMANIVIQGFRMITSQGEQGQYDKAKQRLFTGFIGVGVVLMGEVIVDVAALRKSPLEAGVEIVGIANYLITLFGALAVIAVLVAGIVLVVSVQESMKDQAKGAIKIAFITLLAVLFSAAIIRFFFVNTPQ